MKNKKIIFSFLMLFVMISAVKAQEKQNCYIDYLSIFTERFAKPVTDGVQNVVVTVRTFDGSACKSMLGTIEVKDGKIIGKLLLKTKGGAMIKPTDKLSKKYTEEKKPMKQDFSVVNGMSSSFLTQKNYIVNLFFIDFLNPPQPAMADVPNPNK